MVRDMSTQIPCQIRPGSLHWNIVLCRIRARSDLARFFPEANPVPPGLEIATLEYRNLAGGRIRSAGIGIADRARGISKPGERPRSDRSAPDPPGIAQPGAQPGAQDRGSESGNQRRARGISCADRSRALAQRPPGSPRIARRNRGSYRAQQRAGSQQQRAGIGDQGSQGIGSQRIPQDPPRNRAGSRAGDRAGDRGE